MNTRYLLRPHRYMILHYILRNCILCTYVFMYASLYNLCESLKMAFSNPESFDIIQAIRDFPSVGYTGWSDLLEFPIPVAARSKVWVCGRSLVGIAGSNPTGIWTSVSRKCCLLSGSVLCVGLITGPEESY